MQTLGQKVRHLVGNGFGANLVEQTIEKVIMDVREGAKPKAAFFDPMDVILGGSVLGRTGPLTFQDMRRMAETPLIHSIVQTRVNQVASFAQPQRGPYERGFVIVDDRTGEKAGPESREIEQWLFTLGGEGFGEPNLATFVRKFLRDSLVLDQACAEIVKRLNGKPAYVVAVDAATIVRLKAGLEIFGPSQEPVFAQRLDGKIVDVFTDDEMMFGIRNPQTALGSRGYGMSELETLIRTVTAVQNTERYNSSLIAQGGTHKGILVVKGAPTGEEWEGFKRDFREAIRNAASVWRPPVLRIGEKGEIDWKELDQSNRDMEYAQLFDFLVKQACGVYQIDPGEVNFTTAPTGATTVFQGGDNGGEIKHRRGLQPLLAFLARVLTTDLIKPIDENLSVEFRGLTSSRKEDVEIRGVEVKSLKTVNEVRGEVGLDDLGERGDVILNEVWLKAGQPPEGTPFVDLLDNPENDA
jgi:hypothetical protein